jgi:hypothetical protein
MFVTHINLLESITKNSGDTDGSMVMLYFISLLDVESMVFTRVLWPTPSAFNVNRSANKM